MKKPPKLTPTQIWRAAGMWRNDRNSRDIASVLGLHEASVWRSMEDIKSCVAARAVAAQQATSEPVSA